MMVQCPGCALLKFYFQHHYFIIVPKQLALNAIVLVFPGQFMTKLKRWRFACIILLLRNFIPATTATNKPRKYWQIKGWFKLTLTS